MKKFGKLLTTLAVVGGAAAGAYVIYKKFFATDVDAEDMDEDFDDDFDLDFDDDSSTKREYVSLTPAPETAVTEEDPAEEAPTEESPVDLAEIAGQVTVAEAEAVTAPEEAPADLAEVAGEVTAAEAEAVEKPEDPSAEA